MATAYLAWAAVCFFWGTTYLANHYAVHDMPPCLLAGVRFLIAGSLFLTWRLARGDRLPPRRAWPILAAGGILLLAFANPLTNWAQRHVPTGLTALVFTTTPIWVALLDALTPGGQGLRGTTLGGLALGTLGVAVIFRRDLTALVNPHYVQGLAAVLFASLMWSSGAVLQKRVSVGGSPLATAALQMIFVGFVLVPLGLALGEAPYFRPTAPSLMGLAYLVVFGSIVGYGCFVYALSRLEAGFVASYAYVNPLVAIALGWAVLGERVDWSLAAAAALIVSGVALIQAPVWLRWARRHAALEGQSLEPRPQSASASAAHHAADGRQTAPLCPPGASPAVHVASASRS
jgi:drug/metabolite transporter (DMT)-like permease